MMLVPFCRLLPLAAALSAICQLPASLSLKAHNCFTMRWVRCGKRCLPRGVQPYAQHHRMMALLCLWCCAPLGGGPPSPRCTSTTCPLRLPHGLPSPCSTPLVGSSPAPLPSFVSLTAPRLAQQSSTSSVPPCSCAIWQASRTRCLQPSAGVFWPPCPSLRPPGQPSLSCSCACALSITRFSICLWVSSPLQLSCLTSRFVHDKGSSMGNTVCVDQITYIGILQSLANTVLSAAVLRVSSINITLMSKIPCQPQIPSNLLKRINIYIALK